MKINPVNRIDAAYQAYRKNNQTSRPDEPKQDKVDTVELSNEAQIQLQKDKELKIQQLKSQIENGTYKVDSEKIADKLISLWKSGAKLDE
ncbi:flagellar biosynthesis anti-sigma factor FlgM [Neobacillus notoginsengisoli]|uniref:Negative regulator of flagellin synthesis n=1 Tax=Neobacillus notoginsengisoli TaxID=1578198 RepID=A0A417YJN6_9BACI|nr:flagellar biosynthesis anti-sigma factor FlgM [Neobacillus notoginsengisoli]RHW33327.1 flagellar biosynthesis anti-sigma factor FlgM [Neobacillus notoginsengisoli]